MTRLAWLLLASLLLAQGPALAQDRGRDRDRDRVERREMQPRDDRREMRRERMDRRERREHRFTREEREKLRQDLLDANRDMRRR
jgi:Ni/Co efflux regulator RcnB